MVPKTYGTTKRPVTTRIHKQPLHFGSLTRVILNSIHIIHEETRACKYTRSDGDTHVRASFMHTYTQTHKEKINKINKINNTKKKKTQIDEHEYSENE